jgi:hypothetical protein
MDGRQPTVLHIRLLQPAWIVAIVFLTAAGLTGCLQSYGRLKTNPAVTQAFQEYRMLDDYRYYYSGRENVPTAIIGVDPKYGFESELWRPIESTSDALKKMVERVPEFGYGARGADILTPKGDVAGVWFSRTTQSVVRLENNQLIVYPPHDVYGGKGGLK